MRRRQNTGIRVLLCIVIVCFSLAGCKKASEADVFDTAPKEDPVSGDAREEEETEEPEEDAGTHEERESRDEAALLCVYVCGQVENPGVYALPEGSRVVDAIASAGGMTADAADTYLNQAAVLEDGMKIYVPSAEEAKAASASGGEALGGAAFGGDGSSPSGSEKKVNLNTADKEELMTLNGIGESKAESILAYRKEQGAFKRIDEVKNVSGIGDGIFNKIKENITITDQ